MSEITWESTMFGVKRFVTEKQYQGFSEKVRRWYRPYRCVSCSTPLADDAEFDLMIADAKRAAVVAMRRFPAPNYTITKFAEEAGEVVKAAVHCAENRETVENLVGEITQCVAMLYRLYVEGDGVHGLPALVRKSAGNE